MPTDVLDHSMQRYVLPSHMLGTLGARSLHLTSQACVPHHLRCFGLYSWIPERVGRHVETCLNSFK